MASRLTRALAHFFVFCRILLSSYVVESNLNNLAQDLSDELHNYADRYLKYRDFQKEYPADLTLEAKNGAAIAQEMRENLMQVLNSKIESVKLLSRKAEALNRNYSYQNELSEVNFYDSKNLAKAGSNLSIAVDPTFSETIPISFDNSVIHVPTDVYEGNVTILNIIQWTKGLNKQFRENNNNKDNHLLWQYFGTNKGVYRFYPGHSGLSDKNIMFDNRRRGWYIQGSSSPKDMVIVLDLSGSVVGSKLAIIKLSAVSLLDTLQENDFVNVVLFNKGARMLCNDTKVKKEVSGHKCVKGLLQATDRNKRYLKSLIQHLEAKNVADADAGLALAFDLLKNAKSVSESSQCFKLINFFTDGIESSVREKSLKVMEENIRKSDEDKVRVFSYLIGREKSVDDKPVKEFACRNNGYYFRIETLSDVREKVLKYLNVLSRALVLSHKKSLSWTPLYLDKLGLGMMTSVVIPVFASNNTNGALLGVVGTDVPLPLLTNTVPQYKVGVNGYGFAINNNGFLLFHPKLKREDHYKNLKDDPNVYLTEVEFASENESDLRKLIRSMIKRNTSEVKLETDVISRDERRVTKRNYTFYFTDIPGTSFSSAVAIPEYDKNYIRTGKSADTLLGGIGEDFKEPEGHKVVISPWDYCKIQSKAQAKKPMYIPSELYPTADELEKNLTNLTSIPTYCEAPLLKLLLDDAFKTKRHVEGKNWVKDVKEDEGPLSLFIGTDSGLTRFIFKPSANKTQTVPRDLFNQEFYSRAADYTREPNEFLIISSDTSDVENIRINITTPITFEVNGKKALGAVMGMQIKGETFNELFRNNTSDCKNSETACYLLDEDAYVVASNQDNYTEVGKFFGEVNGAIMENMVNRSIFRRTEHDDSQRICNDKSSDSSSAMRLLNPLWTVKAYLQWWTQTVFWSVVQFNLYSYFWQRSVAVAEDTPKKVSCTETLTFYTFQADMLANIKGICLLSSCPNCEGYEVAKVDKTNLLFVKTDCTCKTPKLSRKPKKKDVKPFTAPDENFRELPQLKCYKYSPNEDTSDCGAGAALKPAVLLIIVVMVINLFVSWH